MAGRSTHVGLAEYHYGVTTKRNEFARVITDPAKTTPGREIPDIRMPPGVTSMTVWVRYQCDDPNASGVAFDHLRLEDLTAAQADGD